MDNTPVPEAPLADSPQGRTPDGDGWFIVNLADAQGMQTESFGAGAGDGPSAVLMVGARKQHEDLLYPVSERAARYGASVEQETADQSVAYGDAWASMTFGKLPLSW